MRTTASLHRTAPQAVSDAIPDPPGRVRPFRVALPLVQGFQVKEFDYVGVIPQFCSHQRPIGKERERDDDDGRKRWEFFYQA